MRGSPRRRSRSSAPMSKTGSAAADTAGAPGSRSRRRSSQLLVRGSRRARRRHRSRGHVSAYDSPVRRAASSRPSRASGTSARPPRSAPARAPGSAAAPTTLSAMSSTSQKSTRSAWRSTSATPASGDDARLPSAGSRARQPERLAHRRHHVDVGRAIHAVDFVARTEPAKCTRPAKPSSTARSIIAGSMSPVPAMMNSAPARGPPRAGPLEEILGPLLEGDAAEEQHGGPSVGHGTSSSGAASASTRCRSARRRPFRRDAVPLHDLALEHVAVADDPVGEQHPGASRRWISGFPGPPQRSYSVAWMWATSGLPETARARLPASKVIQSWVSIRSCGSSRAIRSAIAA